MAESTQKRFSAIGERIEDAKAVEEEERQQLQEQLLSDIAHILDDVSE